MASPTATSAPSRCPQAVGPAFIYQYYHLLHTSPEMVYNFYQDISTCLHPNSSGEMIQVSTLQAINDSIMSFKFNSYIAEIETVDTASSYMDGVCIVVTGCLTSSDNTKRKFAQTFFLAPQDNGFFVLTDIFRFLDENQSEESGHVLCNGHTVEASEIAVSDPVLIQEKQIEVPQSEISMPVSKADAMPVHEVVTETMTVNIDESTPLVPLPNKQFENNGKEEKNMPHPVVEDNDPKKSYSSIVKVEGNSPPKKITAPPTDNIKAKTTTFSSVQLVADTESPKLKVSNDNSLHAEGYSVHVRNLPSGTTTEEAEEVFTKFGPIRPGGVQVKCNHDRFVYGFIEFESLSSMRAAIEASPILFGGKKVYVEEKKTTTRVINGVVITDDDRRGRGPPMRGNYYSGNIRRNDNYQGWNGNFTSHGRGRGGREGYYRYGNDQRQC